jgi:isopentenyl-diphosphate delta-isomerase
VRQSRKLDHLKYSLLLPDGPALSSFADLTVIHNCLPNLSWSDIQLASRIAGIHLNHPVILNAITGGAEDVKAVNAHLAEFACLTHSAMAVGSQYAALEDLQVQESYKIVRKINPDGLILANLGAHATPQQAQQAIEMIGAQMIQIHLNVAQEIIMVEGDRDFSRYLDNIAAIASKVDVPVIVKEVGCGIASEQVLAIAKTGVKAIDTGGTGGTNFMAIEAARSQTDLKVETLHWGIPTAISAIEAAVVLPADMDLMVSGGVRTPLDVVKSLAVGACAVGMAAPIVKMVCEQGVESTVNWFTCFLEDVKRYMLLSGVAHIEDLTKVPLVISGYSKDWLTARGIDITKYAVRKKHG